MNIDKLLTIMDKPALWAKGTHIMWTDPYISEQLQAVHLDGKMDLASRKESSIKRTIDWILVQSSSQPAPMKILELGCGPGLYTEKLAALGHNVSGIDYSLKSIETAKLRAEEQNLAIEYISGSYLEHDFGTEKYDVIFIIYTDFCVLNPDEQNSLLKSVYKALKKGGQFLFDVNHPIRIEEKVGRRSWEAVEKGFWSDKPHLSLHDSIAYPEDKAILEQHVVISDIETRIYRFWTRFFDENDLVSLLEPHGFGDFGFFNDVLEEDGLWNGDNILFCRAVK